MIIGPLTAAIVSGTGVVLETSQITGLIMEVGLKYTFDQGSSMDVTIATKGTSSLAKTILTLTGADTDAWYPIRQALVGTDGAAISGQYGPMSITDPLIITVANAGAGDQLDVWLEML